MQEESPSSMIAPLSDGNAHGIDSSAEAVVVKDEPHAGAKAGKGGTSPSPRPQGPAGVGDGDEPSMPSAGATTGKCGSSRSPRPQGPAGVGDGDEPSMHIKCDEVSRERTNHNTNRQHPKTPLFSSPHSVLIYPLPQPGPFAPGPGLVLECPFRVSHVRVGIIK